MTASTWPKLSLCMIVRDEEEQLARCLDSVKGCVDEMVIVDTGSVDSTVAIAESYGARVLFHAWDGSFSSARNVSLDAATGDWLLVLDADEAMMDGSGLHETLANVEPEVQGFVMPMVNFVGDRDHEEAVTSPAARLFRNRPEYRYSRALHEQILATIQSTVEGAIVRWLDVPIEHYGYLTPVVAERDKVARNLALAEEECKRYPKDAFSWYNLGQEHFRMCRFEEAMAAYRHGFQFLDGLTAGFAPALVKHLVICLLSLKRPQDALDVLADALEAYGGFTDLHACQGHALVQLRRFEEAIEVYRTALSKGEVVSGVFMSDEGVGSFKALWWMAVCQANLSRYEEAEETVMESLRVLGRRRRYLPTGIDLALQYGRCLGRGPEEMVSRIGEALDLDDPRWRDMLVAQLIEKGHREAAEALVGDPAQLSDDTLVSLASAKLRTGAAADALALLERVPREARVALTASWNRLLALALVGRADEAEQVLEREVAEQGEAPMVALYRGLTALWCGRPAVYTATGDQLKVRQHLVELLGTMLAADAMELLASTLPALDWLGWSPVEQAALLGQLYHHAGRADQAIEALAIAIDGGDREVETWQMLGLLVLRQGAAADAEALLAKAIRLEAEAGALTEQSAARAGWLAALAMQGKQDEAESRWQQLTGTAQRTARPPE